MVFIVMFSVNFCNLTYSAFVGTKLIARLQNWTLEAYQVTGSELVVPSRKYIGRHYNNYIVYSSVELVVTDGCEGQNWPINWDKSFHNNKNPRFTKKFGSEFLLVPLLNLNWVSRKNQKQFQHNLLRDWQYCCLKLQIRSNWVNIKPD